MVLETVKETGERHGAIGRIARKLGFGDQSLRTWVAQAEIVAGKRAGLTTEERAELRAPISRLGRGPAPPDGIVHNIRRSDRLGGLIHEYEVAA